MAIEGINFSKMLNFKKTEESKKRKESNDTNPITDKKLTKDEQTILERLRKSGLSQYAAAVMITAMTGPMITSCVNQETTVNVDTSELQKTLKELVELQKLMLLQLQQNTEDNKALIEQNKQIMAILQSLLGTTEDISAQLDVAINLIKTLIEQSNKHDKEFLEKLDAIYDSGLEGNKLLEEILKANNEQNMTLSSIKTLLDNMSKDQGDLYELALKWFKKYEEGDIKHSEMLENIYKEMLKSNEISQKTQNQIKKLKEQLAAKEIKESEYWEKVIKLLESIDGKMDLLQVSIDMLNDSLKVGNEKLSEVIKDFHEDYKDGKITQEEYAKKVVENLIKSNLNDEAIIGKLDEVLKLMASGQLTAAEAMDKVIELLKSIENKLDIMNKSILNISDSIKVGNEKLTDIANNIYIELKEGRITQEEYLKSIVQKLDQSNIDDKTLIGKFDDVLAKFEAGQLSFAEAMSKVIELLGKIDSKLDDIHQTIKVVGEDIKVGNEKLTVVAEKIYKEYVEGRITQEVYFKSILEQLIKSNINDETMIGKFDSILAKVEAGQMTMAEAMSQVIALLKSIESKLDILNEAIKGIGDNILVGNSKLTDLVKNFYNDYKAGKITQEAYMNKVLEAMAKSNMNDEVMLKKFDEISKLIASGQLTLAEAMTKVIDLLNQIKDNTEAIKVAIQQLAKDFPKFAKEVINNQKESLLDLKDIKNNTTDINNTLNEIKANQKTANDNLIKISNNGDKIIANLEILKEQGSNQLTINQVKEFFGPAFDTFMALGIEIKNGMIKIEDIRDAIEKNKVDLTKTNALIETLTNVVRNMDFGTDAMAQVITILNDMKASGTANQEAIMKAFNDALAKLGGIQGSLDALLTTANEINTNFKSFIGAAEGYADKFFTELQNITSGVSKNTTALESYAKQAQEAFLQSQKMQEEQKAILITIAEQMGKGDGNVDIDAIIAKLPNYTQILNEIKEEIGKRPSKDDMITAINGAKTDLTKTNALIQTLTDVVKNLDLSGSGGSADMTEVNRLVGLVLNYLDKAALDNAKNFEEYYKLAQKALDELMNVNQNTKPTTPTTRSSKKSNMPKGWRVYNDSSSMRQMINKYNREQVGNYQAMTSLSTDDVEREIGLV